MKIKYKVLRKDAKTPSYMTAGAAGVDVYASVPGIGMQINSGEIKAINTGISVEVPEGWELQIRSRSGLASKGFVVINAPGTIDSDYRGEIQILAQNMSREVWFINDGDRIAQMVLSRVGRIEWEEADELTKTTRNNNGFGSTGKSRESL